MQCPDMLHLPCGATPHGFVMDALLLRSNASSTLTGKTKFFFLHIIRIIHQQIHPLYTPGEIHHALPILLLLIILVIAVLLFSFEWISPDVTALGVLLLLIILGLVPLNQAFAGFGSDTVMLLLGLLIMTAALMRTGVVEMAGQKLQRWVGFFAPAP